MGKKKNVKGVKIPVFTRGKTFRLIFFIIITAVGFTLNRHLPGIGTFGWGYAFGMVCMAILTG